MYEPIRSKSVHSTVARTSSDFPHRSREEELDIQLAGHLAALLAVTDELRALEPSDELDVAAERLAGQLTRLRGGASPSRASAAAAPRSASKRRAWSRSTARASIAAPPSRSAPKPAASAPAPEWGQYIFSARC